MAGVSALLRNPRLQALGAFLSLTLVAFWLNVASGIRFTGEAWFVQVVRRLAEGESLYSDVFFGAGPLPIYLAMLLVRVFGAEVLVLKFLVAVAYAATLCVGIASLRLLSVSRYGCVAYLLLILLVAGPPPSPFYQVLATLFLILTLYTMLALAAGRMRPNWAFPIAGLLCGLCATSKQNVGFYAVLAVVLFAGIAAYRSVDSHRIASWCRWSVASVGAFGLAVCVVFLPVWLAGDLDAFFDVAVSNKTAYVRYGFVSLSEGVQRLWHALGSQKGTRAWLDSLRMLAFTLPVSTPVSWLVVMRHSKAPGLALAAVCVFSAVALATLYPRTDYIHVVYAVPLLLLSVIAAADPLVSGPGSAGKPSRTARVAGLLTIIVLGGMTVATIVRPVVRWYRGELTVCRWRHFRGALVQTSRLRHVERLMKRLTPLIERETVLFVSARAGFLYLMTGKRNVTAFDYPLSSALGNRGQRRLIAAIERGDVGIVCWEPREGELSPDYVVHYLTTRLRFVQHCGPFLLYARSSMGARRSGSVSRDCARTPH